jgi:hypothetical protein
MKFLLSNNFIVVLEEILITYKTLFSSGRSIDSIKLLISNWSRSSTPIENKKRMTYNNWQTLKIEDFNCETIETFNKIYYDDYLTTKCLYLIQNLIDNHTINSHIIKTALPNLLSIMELQVKMNVPLDKIMED